MKNECYDLYGVRCESLSNGKELIQKSLDVIMEERDSDYTGSYYIFKAEGYRAVTLLENIDHYSNDQDVAQHILEPNFPDFDIVIRVEGFPLEIADTYRSLLLNNQQIRFLERTIL
jgi:hypothetical protein